ncbi:hypothetical protein T10_6980 [Trichinella papuae]|uniref:Uncharacterized protein n=1 Tax=Trichinella papuae TaxID=268474 RepID=A0A0V1MPA4_9BILA|nr:hypothetical protein T10_6980 [Trichinella papuae]
MRPKPPEAKCLPSSHFCFFASIKISASGKTGANTAARFPASVRLGGMILTTEITTVQCLYIVNSDNMKI